MRSYGHAWDERYAQAVNVSEVWERMLRNLLNCHSEAGDLVHMRMVQRLREASRGQGGWKVPCPGGDDEAHVQASGGQQQQRQLLQMLQLLQLQMNQEQDDD